MHNIADFKEKKLKHGLWFIVIPSDEVPGSKNMCILYLYK